MMILPNQHPLIQSYLKLKKISTLDEKTLIPIGILSAVYQDYTGQSLQIDRHITSPTKLVPFGVVFSPSLFV